MALVYKCKACRHPLATCQNTLPHQVLVAFIVVFCCQFCCRNPSLCLCHLYHPHHLYHQASSNIIFIIKHHQASSSIIKHHQAPLMMSLSQVGISPAWYSTPVDTSLCSRSVHLFPLPWMEEVVRGSLRW